ncbi:AAA family ATPase [Neobacillus rhizosphaerae]|uniref:AAA family ATPase n=1 Tax=Neobacillus rhizosphaerae TaxID=2880965 RepID=UPI003D271DC8
MELIYAWIDKFRNFKEVELNFSEKFIINFDNANKCIKITPNNNLISIYPKHITNINAIVGKNSVGKTNLLDVLGLRIDDRNKSHSEIEVIYKKEKGPYRLPEDIKEVIKHSIYFFIYYMGKDDNGEDLFCIEGNDIESFQDLIKPLSEGDFNYWREKYWFAVICNYSSGILNYKYDLDFKNAKGKLAIISLRENLSHKYYDVNSVAPKDDNKISVPRRVSQFESKFLGIKVKMLYELLQKTQRHLFQDELYTLKINYKSIYLKGDNESKIKLQHSYNELNGKDKAICKVLESFVHYYYYALFYLSGNEVREYIKDLFYGIKVESKSLKGFLNYYYDIVEKISDIRFQHEHFHEQKTKQHILKNYKALVDELLTNKNIKFNKEYMGLDIAREVDIQKLLKLISVSVDEYLNSDFEEKISTFNDFFGYSIENLSDGESAYLGFFASLYEQISSFASNKEKYIILLDEPEVRMHPELTRNFINDLILFLEDLSGGKKNFQVIVSTHSPFILSDIQSNNIIFLEKDNNGNCIPTKRTINTFGANIHSLLKDGFFMSSTMGEFATSKIKDVINLINDRKIEDVTEEEKNEWLFIINSIGEPLIKNRIIKMFNDKFRLDFTGIFNENLKLKDKLKRYEDSTKITVTIDMLKKQIENLQKNISELEVKHNDKN